MGRAIAARAIADALHVSPDLLRAQSLRACSIATIDALFKFIATPQYGTEELYDLTTDHGEVRNLVKEQPALAALLREKVRAYRDEGP